MITMPAAMASMPTGLSVEAIGQEIERGLRLIVESLGTDRSVLYEFSPDGKSMVPRFLDGVTAWWPTCGSLLQGSGL